MFASKRKEIEGKLCTLETEHKERYDTLKRNFRYVFQALEQCRDLSVEDKQSLINLIVDRKSNFNSEYLNITQKEQSEGFISWVRQKVAESYSNAVKGSTSTKLPPLPPMDDVTFSGNLELAVNHTPELQAPAKEIRSSMLAILEKKIKKLATITHDIGNALQKKFEDDIHKAYSERDEIELNTAWKYLLQEFKAHLNAEPHRNGYKLTYT
jgi:hypothetical protein